MDLPSPFQAWAIEATPVPWKGIWTVQSKGFGFEVISKYSGVLAFLVALELGHACFEEAAVDVSERGRIEVLLALLLLLVLSRFGARGLGSGVGA
jgi:hypothetical protein